MGILERIKGFFKREVVYHLHFDSPVESEIPEKSFKPLDYHLPIEIEFGNRLIKVEH